ncbi:MAG: efflux RND transporter periplasmic adaptor subunit [Lentisphaeria bacterium]|nr:efflux RND transporter periplasmic adaptor subunit [Lentisphaeria bacterium]
MQKTITFLLVAVLTAVCCSGCRKKAVKEAKERVIRVGVMNPVFKVFQQRIPVQGTVKPVRYATLSSKTSGSLDILEADEGKVMKRNDLLFQVDKSNLENQVTVAQRQYDVCRSEVQTAKIALDLAKIRLRKAQLDFKRAETLNRTKAISQENYESAEVDLKGAAAEVSSSEAQLKIAIAKRDQQQNNLKIAKKNLADSEIRAPFDGIITVCDFEPNEYVKEGTPILKIEDQSLLEVECFISSVYYDLIVPGKTRANFKLDGKNAGSAVITYRSPSVDPISRTFKIKIQLPAKTPLVSGLLCDVELMLQERKGYGVPADAVMTRNAGREVVFVLDQKTNTARMTEVKRGIVEPYLAELRNGAKLAGELVIVSGHTFVNNGDKVIANRLEK